MQTQETRIAVRPLPSRLSVPDDLEFDTIQNGTTFYHQFDEGDMVTDIYALKQGRWYHVPIAPTQCAKRLGELRQQVIKSLGC